MEIPSLATLTRFGMQANMADQGEQRVVATSRAVLELTSSPATGALMEALESNRNLVLSDSVVDYRPDREQLYSSLNQWSDQRFHRYYRMTKGMLYVCCCYNNNKEIVFKIT